MDGVRRVSQRQRWCDFVCCPKRAGRHLAGLGSSVRGASAPPIARAALEAFLAKMTGAGADAALLADAVDLAHPNYEAFCTRELPQLLDALAAETAAEGAVVGPALRGTVRWGPTAVARRSGRLLPTQFIVRLPVRSVAVAENLVLRWLLASLSEGIGALEARVGSSTLPAAMLAVRSACSAALRDERLAGVPASQEPPTPQMVLAARRHRLPAYRFAAELAERRLRRVAGTREARWLRILDLLAAEWLEPVGDDDMFELFTLAVVLDVLESDLGLGEPSEVGLAMRGRDHVARFMSADGSAVQVYFDQSPATVLGTASAYLRLLSAHEGLVGAPRRPDVIVARETAKERIVLLVEAKETNDRGYAGDSVYKAMGYIHDFRELWASGPPRPKVVLVFPDSVRPRPGVAPSELDVVLAHGFDRQALAAAMASRLGLPLPKP